MSSNANKKRDLSLLLVGKTGNGKSSTGNTILQAGEPDVMTDSRSDAGVKFATAHSLNSETLTFEMGTCRLDNRRITVVSTQDLANPRRTGSADDRKFAKREESAESQVDEWMEKVNKNPDAVLLVICCDRRYTKEEYAIYDQLKKLLDQKMKYKLKEKLVVVFTMGESLNGRDLRLDLSTTCHELNTVMDDAGQRYVVFNNKADGLSKKACVNTLLKTVETLAPHPFPQQLCRLLVLGDRVKVKQTVSTLVAAQLEPSSEAVSFVAETSVEGLRLEVTMSSADQLGEKSREAQTSVSPGPHAILLILNDPQETKTHSYDSLEKALGSPQPNLPPIAQFIVLAVPSGPGTHELTPSTNEKAKEKKESEKIVVLRNDKEQDRENLLEMIKLRVRLNSGEFYQTVETRRASEAIQQELNDKEMESYENYLQVKRNMMA